MILTPFIVNNLILVEPSVKGIDGIFNEWRDIQGYSESLYDQEENRDVNLVDYKVTITRLGEMLLYAKVQGTMLNGAYGIDLINMFIDEDHNPQTGYSISNIGADKKITIAGWNNTVETHDYSQFNNSRSSMDLNGFEGSFPLPVEIDSDEMDTKIWLSALDSNPGAPINVVFTARDTAGNEDISDVVIGHIE